MALMRSQHRQGSRHRDGLRTGLKVSTPVENGGLLEYFFGKNGKSCLAHGKFVQFLKDLHNEVRYMIISIIFLVIWNAIRILIVEFFVLDRFCRLNLLITTINQEGRYLLRILRCQWWHLLIWTTSTSFSIELTSWTKSQISRTYELHLKISRSLQNCENNWDLCLLPFLVMEKWTGFLQRRISKEQPNRWNNHLS